MPGNYASLIFEAAKIVKGSTAPSALEKEVLPDYMYGVYGAFMPLYSNRPDIAGFARLLTTYFKDNYDEEDSDVIFRRLSELGRDYLIAKSD